MAEKQGWIDLLFIGCAHTRSRVRTRIDNGDVYTDADRESMSRDKSRYWPETTRGGSFARSMDHRSILGEAARTTRSSTRASDGIK